MITFGRSYIVDGKAFATLHGAQAAALEALFNGHATQSPGEREAMIDIILDSREAIVNILTTKETSLPRARKANGGTKKRSGKPQFSEIQPDGLRQRLDV